MTPDWADERARELTDENDEKYPGWWEQPAAIAAALRTAHNDAIEKAARLLEYGIPPGGNLPEQRFARQKVAAIRAMKELTDDT